MRPTVETHRSAMSRREMVGLLCAGVAILTGVPVELPAATRHALAASSTDAELAEWVEERLGDTDLSAIAAAWTSRHPDEGPRPALERALLADRRRGTPLSAHLAHRVTTEHAAGRAEELDGWYLAPTEARLAALLQLIRVAPR